MMYEHVQHANHAKNNSRIENQPSFFLINHASVIFWYHAYNSLDRTPGDWRKIPIVTHHHDRQTGSMSDEPCLEYKDSLKWHTASSDATRFQLCNMSSRRHLADLLRVPGVIDQVGGV